MTTEQFKFCPTCQGTGVVYTTGNTSASGVVCPTCHGTKYLSEPIDDNTETETMERYAQHMEIKIDDMDWVVKALMRAGYQCLVYQDGESMDVVMIDYVHSEYTGHYFQEVEF